jgi:hypothetical protein
MPRIKGQRLGYNNENSILAAPAPDPARVADPACGPWGRSGLRPYSITRPATCGPATALVRIALIFCVSYGGHLLNPLLP